MLLPPIAVLFATRALADTVTLPVAVSPPASASTPVPGDFQSFSIEFAFFPDFAGRTCLRLLGEYYIMSIL